MTQSQLGWERTAGGPRSGCLLGSRVSHEVRPEQVVQSFIWSALVNL